MLEFDEAQAALLRLARSLGSERIATRDADRRWLAATVVAGADLPAFDYSTMDGYAVDPRDVESGTALPVAFESRTGMVPPPLAPKTTMRIFTGAPLPEGAAAVVPQEDVTREADRVTFARKPKPSAFVRRRGDDRRQGDVVLAKGAFLGPAQLALIASVDMGAVEVAKKPKVTVLATGDELRDPGSPFAPGTIPDSNGASLAALFARAPSDVRVAPRVRDDVGETERGIRAALEGTDLLVVVGGMSVGDHDLVRGALATCGVTIEFFRVAIKPGKPIAVGKAENGALVIGLPGNPASALVTGALFVVPLLRAMQGAERPFPAPYRAALAKAITREPGRLEFIRAVRRDDGTVEPLAHQASGAAWNVAIATHLVMVPKERATMEAGELALVLPFSELGL